MKTILTAIIISFTLNAFADHHEEKVKVGHDKEHQHVKGEEKDHEHDDGHHKKHDHKSHHPEHEEKKQLRKKK